MFIQPEVGWVWYERSLIYGFLVGFLNELRIWRDFAHGSSRISLNTNPEAYGPRANAHSYTICSFSIYPGVVPITARIRKSDFYTAYILCQRGFYFYSIGLGVTGIFPAYLKLGFADV